MAVDITVTVQEFTTRRINRFRFTYKGEWSGKTPPVEGLLTFKVEFFCRGQRVAGPFEFTRKFTSSLASSEVTNGVASPEKARGDSVRIEATITVQSQSKTVVVVSNETSQD